MSYAISHKHTQTLAQWAKDNSDVTYQLREANPDAAIAMHTAGGDEMIKVTRDGFYVRGVKVPADDKEAETVYNAFKQWLSWANLQRR